MLANDKIINIASGHRKVKVVREFILAVEILKTFFSNVNLIATNGRRFCKSSLPKHKDYGKRWAAERLFS